MYLVDQVPLRASTERALAAVRINLAMAERVPPR
jgi:hypothetical protein